MNHVLCGRGTLQIALPRAWHTSITEFDDKTHYQRVYFSAVRDVGSINYNLGWLGMKALFQESTAEANIYDVSDQINIHQGTVYLLLNVFPSTRILMGSHTRHFSSN